MTDGPFKNLRLSASHKRIVETLGNDAFDDTERSDRICHANLKDLSAAGDLDLVAALMAEARNDQLDLDPMGTVEDVCGRHDKTPFADKLQQELTYRIQHGASLEEGLEQALPSAVERQTQECSNRIQEELLRAQEAGDARPEQVADAMKDLHRALGTVPVDQICDAVKEGNKDAFKESVSKKQGENEGPRL